MMDNSDLILYGGALVSGVLVVFLEYRLFRKKGAKKPKSEAMNKISDFLATQDKNHNY